MKKEDNLAIDEIIDIVSIMRVQLKMMKKYHINDVEFDEKCMVLSFEDGKATTLEPRVYEKFKELYWVKLWCDRRPPFTFEVISKFATYCNQAKLTKKEVKMRIVKEFIEISNIKKN